MRSHPSFIVGIGGSAGGLSAYKALLEAMPIRTEMAFVIVPHLLPTSDSQLAQILSRHTKMRVTVVSVAMRIQANHVYVSAPNADLFVDHYSLKVVSPRTTKNNQIDMFLTSLASSMGPYAIGIIMSGYGHDGTEGCKRIKAVGGTTFAQDGSAEVSGMPRSAQVAGCVDLVLPPERMPEEIQRISRSSRSSRSGSTCA